MILPCLRFTFAIASMLAIGGIGNALAVEVESRDASNEQVVDARREMQILARFNMTPQLHAYDLTVIVDGSDATLGGAVETAVARDLAGQIAIDTLGIKHVMNRIRVDADAAPRRHSPIGTAPLGSRTIEKGQ